MNPHEHDRLQSLVGALGTEIVLAKPGSDQGQFPILDLLGNIRDEAARFPAMATLQAEANAGWEKVLAVVESGKPFEADQVQWLGQLFQRLESLAEDPAAATALAEATPPPAPTPAPPNPSPAAETDEEVPLSFNAQTDGELLREFITESREHLDNIEQGVIVLEQQPDDAATLNTIFRAFHTFKGGAGFLNLIPINRLAHVLESLLDLARQHQLAITPPVIDLILRGRDTLKHYLDEIDAQLAGQKPNAPCLIPTAALKAQVRAMIENPGLASTVSVPPSAPAAVAPILTPVPEITDASTPGAPGSTSRATAAVKVDTLKLDAMVDMVGELVIAQSLVTQNLSLIGETSPQFARNLGEVARITKELQRVSLALRMVPIRGAFQKMARVVRDLAAKQKKKVVLVTEGEDTELDRSVVDELNDPLLHMIRNSVDHGIESSEKRAAQGKPAQGTIRLRAYHQSGNIVIEVCDDGAGLNRQRILSKAVEKGLVSPEAQLTEAEISELLFAPGFSTAEKITDVSGRGVGLDVVRRNIEKLRGCVEVSSASGEGTTFKMMLPLTLAIIDGLVLRVGQERYIVPTLSVRESFRPTPGMLSTIQGRGEVLNVRGRLIPLLRLHEHFGITGACTDPTQGIVLVAQSGASLRCVLVDQLLNKQEVVIKSLGHLLQHQNPALAGAAILGDGRVGLILDVNALVHIETKPLQKAA